MGKHVTDGAVISALISCGSIGAAAKNLGVSASTITNRLQKPEFRERYDQIQSEHLQTVAAAMSASITASVKTLCEVMLKEENPPTVRASAADALLRHGLRYIEAGNLDRRLSELESKMKQVEGDNAPQ